MNAQKCVNNVLFNLDTAKFCLLAFIPEYLTDYYIP